MIKLKNIINEEKEQYIPYMYSEKGFGCHVCKFHYEGKDGKHMCNNEDYVKYMGTEELLDSAKNPIKDPSKWCSNWFKPAS